MDNDPLQQLFIAYGDAEVAFAQAMQSQEQHGPDLQADGLVGILDTLLDVISEELPKLIRLLTPSHD